MLIFFILNNISFFLFTIGLWGLVVTESTVMIILMALELIIFSVIVNLITYSSYLDDSQGQTFSLFLLTIAAAESALGLAISVIYYKLRGTLKNIFVSTLKT